MATLNERIKELEEIVKALQSKLEDLSANTEGGRLHPETILLSKNRATFSPIGIGSGFGAVLAGAVLWNNVMRDRPGYGKENLTVPESAYHRHSHSQWSGGALDINTLELVEYETNEAGIILDQYGNRLNRDCQDLWKYDGKIATQDGVPKIGNLNIAFNPVTGEWDAGANFIDVERTYFVQYVWKLNGSEVPAGTVGATKEIKTDSNGNEMKSALLYTASANPLENANKSNIVWDEDAITFRFYAVFKPYPEEEEE